MSFNTPPRPLPGAYLQTPGTRGFQQSLALHTSPSVPSGANPQTLVSRQPVFPQSQQLGSMAVTSQSKGDNLDLITRAGRTLENVFNYESEYPDLDNYVGQGVSNQYDLTNDPAWDPFQTVKLFPIPDDVFDQYNRAQITTTMGLFAELGQAWVTIDNALYMWDYSNPSTPSVVGVEEQPHCITAIHLGVPKAGIFLPEVKRMLILATVADIRIYGVSWEERPGGTKAISLHQSKMLISIGGLEINQITSSRQTGRIFFAGTSDDHVYEFTYQPEERWFSSRCQKINHTIQGVANFTLPFSFKAQATQYVQQICVDDSRQLLYTLSSNSTIRVFHMTPAGGLSLFITKPLSQTYSDIGNRATGNIMSDTLNTNTRLAAISPIPAQEATKLHLMAVTTTGYRIYYSATTRYGWAITDTSQAPTTLQVQHIKLPPRLLPDELQLTPNQLSTDSNQSIKSLPNTHKAHRIPPGYFLCFASTSPQAADTLFISSVDSGRTTRTPPASASGSSRFYETQMFVPLNGKCEDVGMIHPPYAAKDRPAGYGNESSLQFDKLPPEIAILTNSGVHVVRRRRHVDIFAAFARQGGTADEGRAGLVKMFIRRYGIRETIATALAVACGQGVEVSSDLRVTKMTDATVLDFARNVFIKEGGKPTVNENLVQTQPNPIDAVRPSPRHFGLVLYLSRIIRSVWNAYIVKESRTTAGGYQISSSIPKSKLQDIQKDLVSLQEFLKKEKSAIDGLSGPEILARASTQWEEIAYQGEHRDMQAVVHFINSTIEGISFVLVLFEERVEEIAALLPEDSKSNFLRWTFVNLFTSPKGRELAKEVVKAIVTRNISKGSNVETIADSLRRKCGSFCSAEDVVIFRAQEFLKRASEAGSNTEASRNQLNESLRLFTQVAESLPLDYLGSAVEVYVGMQFFAGAISLALAKARESDRSNLALSWMKDANLPRADTALVNSTSGLQPYLDPRENAYNIRSQCYNIIHEIISALDEVSSRDPDSFEGGWSIMNTRRLEAYEVINISSDEVFLTNLYDWYLGQGWDDRILEADTSFVETYLQRRAQDSLGHADLLWRYYAQKKKFFEAADTQFKIAQSGFQLSLDGRIEYLSRAKANVSTRTTSSHGSRSWQELKQNISDCLDLANVQDDILQRLKTDPRIPLETRPEILGKVDGAILSIQELFNQYADFAGYYDICLMLYGIADLRDTTAIQSAWENTLKMVHESAINENTPLPYEAVIEKFKDMAFRLRMSEFLFPVRDLVAMLEKYKFEFQRGVGPPEWVMDLFLDLEVPHEIVYAALEAMFYNDEVPFHGQNRRHIGNDLVILIQRWFTASSRSGNQVFGSDAVANMVSEMLSVLLQLELLDERWAIEAATLRAKIEPLLR